MRSTLRLVFVTVLLLAQVLAASIRPASAAVQFHGTGDLNTARIQHAATLLWGGKVLVSGGYGTGGILSSAELYDPAAGTWSITGSLLGKRQEHTMTLLPDGKVLAAGGSNGTPASTAELYDPAAGTWTPTGNLAQGRYYHTATLLNDGRVLVAGGWSGGALASAEVYDPVAGTWSATASLGTARYYHTATLLNDGKVLVAGGSGGYAGAELYDPVAGIWSATGDMGGARSSHTAVLLNDNRVLAAGGDGQSTGAELYEPSSGQWSLTGSLSAGRTHHRTTLLGDGTVLLTGGIGFLASTELYDPLGGGWSAASNLGQGRYYHTATMLGDGRVLISGGLGTGGYLRNAEIALVTHAPALDPIGPRSVAEGATLTFTVSGSDPDAGDTLVYAATNLPIGASFQAGTQTFTWTPGYDQAGTYPGVRFQVSDGVSTDAEEIAITVADSNRTPNCAGEAYTVVTNGALVVPAPGVLANDSDPDGDGLTAAFASHPAHGDVTMRPDGSFTYVSTPGYEGIDSFAYRAGDGIALSAEVTVTVHVTHDRLVSTLLGGGAIDWPMRAARDRQGNWYVVGQTASTDFPTTAGAFDRTYNGGSYTGFVAKLNQDLSQLLASTFIGGSGGEGVRLVSVGEDGNVYVAGGTRSTNLPTTVGAFDRTYAGGGSNDGFVSVFSSDLSALLHSTYLGGSGDDVPMDMVIEASGTVLLLGQTPSADFPVTVGVRDTTFNGGMDLYVTRLSADLSSVLASTYLGGSGTDAGGRILAAPDGSVYVSGYSASADYPVTTGAADVAHNGGHDIVVSRLSHELTVLQSSTFLGGSYSETLPIIKLAPDGDIYVAGATTSADFPATGGAYDLTGDVPNSPRDVFVARLDSALTTLKAATFLGGYGATDEPADLSVAAGGEVFVAGYTSSTSFPVSEEVFDQFATGPEDGFVARLSADLSVLHRATYVGADGFRDRVVQLHLLQQGRIGLVGYTYSPGFPVTDGAYDTVKKDGSATSDGFVCLLNEDLTGYYNWRPVLSPVGNKSTAEGALLQFALTGMDQNAEPLTYGAIVLPPGASLNSQSGLFTWTPGFTQSGVYSVTVSVSDGGVPSLTDTETISITVVDVNQAPALDPIGGRSVAEGSQLSFTVSATDPDWDGLSFSATNLPAGASFDAGTRTFGWTPGYDQAGMHANVRFEVSDGTLADFEEITITVENTNRAPMLDPVGGRSVAEGTLLAFSVGGSDPDDDALVYGATNLPAGADFDAVTRTFSWTPGYDQVGTYASVRFEVSDGTLVDFEEIAVAVANTNRAPTLTTVSGKAVAEGAELIFTLNASDADDGDTLTFTASNLPAGASFDPVARTFSWTPGYDQAGTYASVRFEVSDGMLSDFEEIAITVADANRAPALDPVGDRTVAEGVPLSFAVLGTDPDGDSLTYGATNLPAGATFDAATRTFSWTPGYAQAGLHATVRFAVSDGTMTDFEEITVTVSNTNRAPHLAEVERRTVVAGQSLAIALAASDPDGDPLLFSTGAALPAGAVLEAATGAFSWSPAVGQVGLHTIVFTVSDQGTPALADTQLAVITVELAPPPPDTAAPVYLEAPAALSVTHEAAVIRWLTDEPGACEVRWGATPSLERSPVVAVGLAESHEVTLSGLAADTVWYAQAACSDAAHNGPALSRVLEVRTLEAPDTLPPVIVEGPMAINVTDVAAIVVWKTDEPATGSVLCSSGAAQTAIDEVGFATEHRVLVTGLTPETVYRFVIASADRAGNGPTLSLEAQFTTGAAPDRKAPEFLETPFVHNVTHKMANLRWVTDEAASGAVEYGLAPDALTGMEAQSAPRTHHELTLTQLLPGTTYFFRVSSTDTSGNGPLVSSVLQFTTRESPRAVPPVFTAGPTVAYVTDVGAVLSWETDVPTDAVVEYRVQPGRPSAVTDPVLRNGHQLNLVNLVPGTSYDVAITATDADGNVATVGQRYRAEALAAANASPEADLPIFIFSTPALPDATPPVIVSGPTVLSVDDGSAAVGWLTDEIADSLVVCRERLSGAILSRGTIADVATHLEIFTGLAPGTTFDCAASSVDPGGNGPASAPVSFTTSPAADTDGPVFVESPAATGATASSVTIAWRTDEPSSTRVICRATGGTDLQAGSPGLALEHSLVLTGLSPCGSYTYEAVSADHSGNSASSPTAAFATACGNGAPTLAVPAGKQVTEGKLLSFSVAVSDPDGDTVILSASGLPAGAEFDAATGILRWRPRFDQAGQHEIRFRATDNGTPSLSSEQGVAIVVAQPAGAVFSDDFTDGAASRDWRTVLGQWKGANGVFSSILRTGVNLARIFPLDPATLPVGAGIVQARIKLTADAAGVEPNAMIVFAYRDAGHYRWVQVTPGAVSIGQTGNFGGVGAGLKRRAHRAQALDAFVRYFVEVRPDGTVLVFRGSETAPTVAFRFANGVKPSVVAGGVGLGATKARSVFDNVRVWEDSVFGK